MTGTTEFDRFPFKMTKYELVNVLSFYILSVNYLRNFNFNPWTTDEEKIIWDFTRGFPQRKIQTPFHYGSDKVSKTIRHFKQTGSMPAPSQQHLRRKLTENVLLYIESEMQKDARTTNHQKISK